MNLDTHHIDPVLWEKIEAYLSGQLSESEKEEFSQEIASNPSLQEQVRTVQSTIIGIKEFALQEQMHSWSISTEKNRIFYMSTWKVISIAASLLILIIIGVWWFNQPNATDKLYTQYYEQDPGLPTMMSNSVYYEMDKIMIEYKSGNYSKALRSWEKMLVDQPENDTIQYFIACAHLALGNTTDALVFLSHVSAQMDSPFYNEANWYMGLTLLKLQRTDVAQKYIEQSVHPLKEKLLQEIQQLHND